MVINEYIKLKNRVEPYKKCFIRNESDLELYYDHFFTGSHL